MGFQKLPPTSRATPDVNTRTARYVPDPPIADFGSPHLVTHLETASLEGVPAYMGTRPVPALPHDQKEKPDTTPAPPDAGTATVDHPGDIARKPDAKDAAGDRAADAKTAPPKAGAEGGAKPAPKAAAKASAKSAPAGGGEDEEDDALDLADEISDLQATSKLVTEWFAEPNVMFDDVPLSDSFEGATRIDLKVAAPPQRRSEEGVGSNAMSGEDAARQAAETYAGTAASARDAHEGVVASANRGARRVFEQTSEAINRLDLQLAPTLDEIVATMTFERRELDGAADAAQAHLEAEVRFARRRTGGAAAAGRAAVSASAKRAVDVELPKVHKELRERFEKLYGDTSTKIAESGKKASDELHESTSHQKLAADWDYSDTGGTQARAAKEAARPEIPPRMDYLGDTIKKGSDKNAKDIGGRLDTPPPKGGRTIGLGIKEFVDSMRQNITGDAAGAGAAAVARAKAGGASDPDAKAAGAKASAETTEAGSLEARGHKAIGKSHGEALGSLAKQHDAARKSVRHAKRSGEKQLATQRSGALTRLAGLRRARMDAMRDTANQAGKALRGGAKTAVTFYADSTKKLGETLTRAADRGPAALSETMKLGVPPVTTALADGKKVQSARLDQVTDGAGRSVARLSDSVQADARGASLDFERTMGEVSRQLAGQVDDAARSHSKHFADVARGVTQTTQSFTQPLPVMFKKAIDETKKSLDPIYDAEDGSMKKVETSVTESNAKMADAPKEQLQDRLEAAKKQRDENLGARAKAMRAAWGLIMLDEDALMENARGVTALGGDSICIKFPGNLRARLEEEHDAILGGLNDDEYNAIINYLAGRTAEGALYEMKTTVHWYGNEGKRATEIIETIGTDARNKLMGRSDWPELANEIRGGLRGTDKNVFSALEMNREVLAKAYRSKDAVDKAREKNDKDALFIALTPYQGEAIREGKVVSAEEQLSEFQREFAVATGKAKSPTEISQEAAAKEFADYATRPVTVLVDEGYGEHSHLVEKTYTLSGPETALARALATKGPNDEETKAARILHESERSGGKPNLEQLENAVIDPRLNPALTPNLTEEQRKDARAQQDQLFLRYAELAKKYGVKVEGENPAELRQYVAGRLGKLYGNDDEDRLGARYAGSIVLKDKPDAVAAMRYSMERSGTDVALMRRTLGRMTRKECEQLAIDYGNETGKSLYAEMGVYGHSGGEVSGDERLEMEVLLMGVPQNDRERAEVALYKNWQQQTETGIAGKAALKGGIEETRLLAADADLQRMIGGSVIKDRFGRPLSIGGSFDDKGKFTGGDKTEFMLAVNRATYTAESYAAAIDRLAAAITTIIAVIGAVVAAVLTVVTGGLAAPLMIAALSFGLAGMAANALIRGGRYGWEEALTDLGMVGVQVLTAGLGAQLGAAAKTASTAAAAARTGGTAVAKAGLARMFTGNVIVDQIMIGAITGGVGGVGQTALQAETWRNGIVDGIGNSLIGGVRGSLAGAATSAATNAMEALPLSRGALAAMRAGKDYRSLGSEIQRMSAGGGVLRGTLGVAGRGVARGGLQMVGGIAGHSTELAFDAATGHYHGSLTDALDQVGEAGLRSGLQGIAEGGGEAFGQRHDIANPHEAIEREQMRMKQLKEENASLRGALHEDAVQAAQPPPAPELPEAAPSPVKAEPDVGARTGRAIPPSETVAGAAARPLAAAAPETERAIARTPVADEAARIARPTSGERTMETAGAEITQRRPAGVEEEVATRTPASVAPHGEVEGAAGRMVGTEMELAPTQQIKKADEHAVLAKAMTEIAGEGGPLRGRVLVDEPHPDGGRLLLVERADGEPITVRVIVKETEGGNIANFAAGMEGEDFVVMLSPRARESTQARALAHEIEELRFHGLAEHAAESDLLRPRPGGLAADARLTKDTRPDATKLQQVEHDLAQARATTPREDKAVARLEKSAKELTDKLPEQKLSAHDRGRLAELQVLDGQLQRARGATPRDEVVVARLEHETQALVAHLGLVSGPAAPARRAALERVLAAEGAPPMGRSLSTVMNEAVTGAAANPLLRPRPTTLEDAVTLAGQINRARALGSEQLANDLTLLARGLVRERFGGPLPHEAGEIVKTLDELLVRDIANENDRRAVAALVADVADRESARSRAIARDNEARAMIVELGRVRADADPKTSARLQTSIKENKERLSGAGLSKEDLSRRLSELARLPASEKLAARDEMTTIKLKLEGAELHESQARDLHARISNDETRLAALRAAAPELPARIAHLESEIARLGGLAETEWHRANRANGEEPNTFAEASLRPKPLDSEDDLGKGVRRDARSDAAEHELIRQRFGDVPGFQEFGELVDAYYKRYPDKRKGGIDVRAQVERELFDLWSRGHYFDPATGKIAQLEELRYLSATGGRPPAELAGVAPPKLAPTDPFEVPVTSRPLHEDDAKAIVSEINARRKSGNQPELGEAEQSLLRAIVTDRDLKAPSLTIAQGVELSVALTTVRNRLKSDLNGAPEAAKGAIVERLKSVETAIRDVREALGVAAGRQVAEQLFPKLPKLMEGSGADTVDIARGDVEQGPLLVLECKGKTGTGRGTRQATIEGTGEPVTAEQGRPEYLRSVAQAMKGGPDAVTGAAILKGMASPPPEVRFVIVRQEILADGSLGSITVVEFDMSAR